MHGTQALVAFLAGLVLLYPASPVFAQRQRTLDSLLAFGQTSVAAGDVENARACFTSVLERFGENASARVGLGKTYMLERAWRPARDEFEKALRNQPESIEADYCDAICYREMGVARVMGMQTVNARKARMHFLRVLDIDSSFEDVLYQFALCEERSDEFDHAISLCEAEVRLHPDLVEPHLGLLLPVFHR